ncbi:hypothetical protein QW060_08690 [Myroides ceti]|uniref:Uncharacterized protein n=1 Tax=Paenimyroides ceti TaxID=395087 RepID=A0ABT8CS38_9FLAO|nr:hypothetical protein [Paenimyroides ceti]MDN3707210.1 hypothetical protein [Paenimyroides ceti]
MNTIKKIIVIYFLMIGYVVSAQLPIEKNFIGSYEYKDERIKIEIDIKKVIINAPNGDLEVMGGDMYYSIDGKVIFNKVGLKSNYNVQNMQFIPFLVINNMDKTVSFTIDKCKQVMELSDVDGKKFKLIYSDERTKSKNRSIRYFNKSVSTCQLPSETILTKK